MTATPVTPRTAARRPHWPLFLGLAAAIPIADQLTKAWVVGAVEAGRPLEIAGEYLRLAIVHNSGALFGMFRDQAPIFALVSLAVVGLIVWYESKVGASLLATLALGLLLGGAIGNLIDRVRLGYVVDFVDMGIGDWRFYTYNVADAAITCSILLLLLLALRGDGDRGEASAEVGLGEGGPLAR